MRNLMLLMVVWCGVAAAGPEGKDTSSWLAWPVGTKTVFETEMTVNGRKTGGQRVDWTLKSKAAPKYTLEMGMQAMVPNAKRRSADVEKDQSTELTRAPRTKLREESVTVGKTAHACVVYSVPKLGGRGAGSGTIWLRTSDNALLKFETKSNAITTTCTAVALDQKQTVGERTFVCIKYRVEGLQGKIAIRGFRWMSDAVPGGRVRDELDVKHPPSEISPKGRTDRIVTRLVSMVSGE